jgi:hypothetical protein
MSDYTGYNRAILPGICDIENTTTFFCSPRSAERIIQRVATHASIARSAADGLARVHAVSIAMTNENVASAEAAGAGDGRQAGRSDADGQIGQSGPIRTSGWSWSLAARDEAGSDD